MAVTTNEIKRVTVRTLIISASVIFSGSAGLAQQFSAERGPLGFSVEGLYAVQTDTDLDRSGSFSIERAFLRSSVSYRLDGGTTLGLALSYAQLNYDFEVRSPEPWDNIKEYGVSAFARVETAGLSLFVSPSLRYAYEDGADEDEGETFGVFLGATWEVSDQLTLGPGIGVFSELGEDENINIFPAILIDWQITERWMLSTGPTIGASQGPGLTLSYDWTDEISLGLTGRYEKQRFRLDDDGPASGGVGEDRSFPLVLSVSYTPNPGMALSVFAGAEIGGQLTLEDAAGNTISEEDYDPAPVLGLAARLRF